MLVKYYLQTLINIYIYIYVLCSVDGRLNTQLYVVYMYICIIKYIFTYIRILKHIYIYIVLSYSCILNTLSTCMRIEFRHGTLHMSVVEKNNVGLVFHPFHYAKRNLLFANSKILSCKDTEF